MSRWDMNELESPRSVYCESVRNSGRMRKAPMYRHHPYGYGAPSVMSFGSIPSMNRSYIPPPMDINSHLSQVTEKFYSSLETSKRKLTASEYGYICERVAFYFMNQVNRVKGEMVECSFRPNSNYSRLDIGGSTFDMDVLDGRQPRMGPICDMNRSRAGSRYRGSVRSYDCQPSTGQMSLLKDWTVLKLPGPNLVLCGSLLDRRTNEVVQDNFVTRAIIDRPSGSTVKTEDGLYNLLGPIKDVERNIPKEIREHFAGAGFPKMWKDVLSVWEGIDKLKKLAATKENHPVIPSERPNGRKNRSEWDSDDEEGLSPPKTQKMPLKEPVVNGGGPAKNSKKPGSTDLNNSAILMKPPPIPPRPMQKNRQISSGGVRPVKKINGSVRQNISQISQRTLMLPPNVSSSYNLRSAQKKRNTNSSTASVSSLQRRPRDILKEFAMSYKTPTKDLRVKQREPRMMQTSKNPIINIKPYHRQCRIEMDDEF